MKIKKIKIVLIYLILILIIGCDKKYIIINPENKMKIIEYSYGSETNINNIFIFIHGGAWKHGSAEEFDFYARNFALEEALCFSLEYRLVNEYITPLDSIDDLIGSINFIKNKYKISVNDRRKIILVGGSAGGHLAYWVAEKYSTEKFFDYLILIDPVVNTTEFGFGADILGNFSSSLSPTQNIVSGLPSTLVIHSELDSLISLEDIEEFIFEMRLKNNKVDLEIIENQKHGSYIIASSEVKRKIINIIKLWVKK